MTVMQRVVKPRTRRSKRALDDRAPKLVENTKKCLFLHGQKTSENSRQCMKDLYALKKQHSLHLQKKNSILPFEDILPVERLAQKYDMSLFCFNSHSKKRPHNLIMGRMFNHHLLDMIELGVDDFKALQTFKNAKISSGNKPCMIFAGAEFDDLDEFKRLKTLLIDFFRGVDAQVVRLQGFEHALQFAVVEGKVLCRSYRIALKRSGGRVPRVELEEIGPSMTLTLRRTRLASDDLWKRACRKPKLIKDKSKTKNLSRDVFGAKLGRIHMTSQDLGGLQTRKMKALKTKKTKETKAATEKGVTNTSGFTVSEGNSSEPMTE